MFENYKTKWSEVYPMLEEKGTRKYDKFILKKFGVSWRFFGQEKRIHKLLIKIIEAIMNKNQMLKLINQKKLKKYNMKLVQMSIQNM